MARATSSLLLPISPLTWTVEDVVATCSSTRAKGSAPANDVRVFGPPVDLFPEKQVFSLQLCFQLPQFPH
jgi:hypothetical protein